MPKTISIIVYGETAKKIAKSVGLKMVGDITDVNTKIVFERMSAEGRDKIRVTFDL